MACADLCNRSSEEYNVLKISLEGQIEELERTFEAAHQAYLQNTGARASAFQTLTTNDAAAARVIEQRMKKLVHMQVTGGGGAGAGAAARAARAGAPPAPPGAGAGRGRGGGG